MNVAPKSLALCLSIVLSVSWNLPGLALASQSGMAKSPGPVETPAPAAQSALPGGVLHPPVNLPQGWGWKGPYLTWGEANFQKKLLEGLGFTVDRFDITQPEGIYIIYHR